MSLTMASSSMTAQVATGQWTTATVDNNNPTAAVIHIGNTTVGPPQLLFNTTQLAALITELQAIQVWIASIQSGGNNLP